MEENQSEQETTKSKLQEALTKVKGAKRLIEDTMGIVKPAEQRNALRRQVSMVKTAVLWRLRTLVLVVYTMRKPDGRTRVRVQPAYKAARLPFLNQVLTHMQGKELPKELEYLKDVKHPMVFVQNDQDPDKSGRVPEMPWLVIAAMNAVTGMVMVKGKTLVNRKVLRLISRTLKKASESVYIKRLGAPLLGNGFFVNPKVILKQLKVKDLHGQEIVQGADGSGKIHIMHPNWDTLGVPIDKRGAMQVTVWHPLWGILWKGILVACMDAVDEEGMPAIVLDCEMAKGHRKDKIKESLKAGKTFTLSEGLYLGVMNKWDEPGHIKGSFQFLQQFLTGGKHVEKMIDMNIHQEVLRFKRRGGLHGIAEKLALDDEQLAMCYALCDLIGWKPIWIAFYRSQIEERLERWIWLLVQGAGLKADRLIACCDNSIPRGYCVIRGFETKHGWRYSHGQEVVVTRSPIVLSQGIRILKCLDPANLTFEESGYLSHLLVKTSKGRNVPYMMIFMNTEDLVEGTFGDDDGDPIMVFDQLEVIAAVRHDLRPPLHGENAVYALEPEKDLKGARAEVPMWEGKGPSAKAERIIGTSSMGPVGPLAIYQAAFYAIGNLCEKWYRYALAVAGGEQEALDSEKHNVIVSCLNAMARSSNWVLKKTALSGQETYGLKPGLKADESCLEDPEAGKDYLSVQWIVNWFRILTGAKKKNVPVRDSDGEITHWEERLIGGDKLPDVLPWRPEPGEPKKRLSWQQLEWRVNKPSKGETPVNYSMKKTYEYLKEEVGDMLDVDKMPESNLAELLPRALGKDPKTLRMPKAEYRELLERAGLVAYGKVLKRLWQPEDGSTTDEGRTRRMEKEEAILAEKMVLFGKLSLLTVEELAIIWYMELSEKVDPDYKDSKINRAFRAVCFPGSPVLAALGVDVPFTCTWAALRMDAIEEKIRNLELTGKAGDIVEAALMHIANDADHQIEVGTPMAKCRHCRELVKYKGISLARARKGLTKDFNAFVAKLVGPINRKIAELIQWTPPKQ